MEIVILERSICIGENNYQKKKMVKKRHNDGMHGFEWYHSFGGMMVACVAPTFWLTSLVQIIAS